MRPTILVLALLSTASPALAQSQPPATPQPTTTTTPAQVIQPQATPQPASPAPTAAPAPTPTVQPTASAAAPTTQPGTPARSQCPECADAVNAYWVAFAAITGFLIIAVLGTLASLKASERWSLADALSEKTIKRVVTPQGANQQVVSEQPELVGSASRLIATLGTLVLAAIMLGVGYGMIWSLFTRGQIPALEGIGPYLLGGAALFTPYAFNQLKEAFKPGGR